MSFGSSGRILAMKPIASEYGIVFGNDWAKVS
jgi:hypothetical protein